MPAGPKFKTCSDPSQSSYEVAGDGKSITFRPCGITSWHPEDVRSRFCGLCRSFITSQIVAEVRDPGPDAVDRLLVDMEELILKPTDVARSARRLRAHIQTLRAKIAYRDIYIANEEAK